MRSLLQAGMLWVAVCSTLPIKAAEPKPTDEKAVRAILDREMKGDFENLTVKELCQSIGTAYGLPVRIDTAAMKRLRSADAVAAVQLVGEGPQANEIRSLYETKIEIPLPRGMTVADVLAEICSQMPGKWSYRVRDTIVLIGPAFEPAVAPGHKEGVPQIPEVRIMEQLMGESVNIQVKEIPLTKALEELRRQTGANIVLDRKVLENAKAEVTATFNDARLLTVLQTLADMAELKVASVNNVFYVTSPENADRLQAEHNRDLFGDPDPTIPATPKPAE
jgi:hypothetical protein